MILIMCFLIYSFAVMTFGLIYFCVPRSLPISRPILVSFSLTHGYLKTDYQTQSVISHVCADESRGRIVFVLIHFVAAVVGVF